MIKVPTLVALTGLFLMLAAASPVRAESPSGMLKFAFEDVTLAGPDGEEPPFPVKTDGASEQAPCIVISGNLVVSWSSSLLESFAPMVPIVGTKTSVMIYVGEDDTTPSPVGFISAIGSNLFPEINDEEDLAHEPVEFTVPAESDSATVPFKIVVPMGAIARNDDASDVELVLTIPERVEVPRQIKNVNIGNKLAIKFCKSVKIDKP